MYAIPVEHFLSADAARAANAWFLAAVALWRVGLLAFFLITVAELTPGVVVVATLLPVAIIVVVLSAFNLEHVVFHIMSGIKPEETSVNDAAYGIVFALSLLSYVASPLLLVLYSACVYRAWVPAGRDGFRPDIGLEPDVIPPGVMADGTQCFHVGETAPFCTKCWMNLHAARQQER